MSDTFRDAISESLDRLSTLTTPQDASARLRVASPLRAVLTRSTPPPDMSKGGRALASRAADLLEGEVAVDVHAIKRLLSGAMPPAPADAAPPGAPPASTTPATPPPAPSPAPARLGADALAAAMGEPPPPAETPPPKPALSISPRKGGRHSRRAPAAPRELPRFVIADGERETVREFVVEAGDYLGAAEAALLTLEDRPEDVEAIAAVFRAFHTIKGVASFMTLSPVAELAHHAETLLGRIRDGELRCVGDAAELAFQSLDLLRAMFDTLATADEGVDLALPPAYAALMTRLVDPAAGTSAARVRAAVTAVASPAPAVAPPAAEPPPPAEPARGPDRSAMTVRELPRPRPQGRRGGGEERDDASTPGADVAKPEKPEGEPRAKRSDAEATIRVRTDRLDRLIDMVGELVIAQAMLSEDELLRAGGSLLLQNKVAQATKIVRELHDSTLSLRMVPLRATFQKVARVARDVSHRVGKQVQVVVEGEDTEIDRNTVELLADPLIHMVRNAIDHGIEAAEVRQAGNKGPAQLAVRAYRAGSDVVIEVEDDGKGIDPAVILRKAVEKGLVGPDVQPTEHQTLMLIFEPGFSTRDQVSEISGRGVGMDVVKRAVDALKGAISIHSVVGKGTRFTIRLPLTLAMTDGLLVGVGGHRYVIPLANISESIRPTTQNTCTVAERGEFVSARGELVPIIRLASLFGLAGRPVEEGLLVIVTAGAHRYAVLVDELLGQQQVVAKSLGPLGAAPTIAGGAILGDGRVGLILDPGGLLAAARAGTAARDIVRLAA